MSGNGNGNDRWDDLPDVVALLQAEASASVPTTAARPPAKAAPPRSVPMAAADRPAIGSPFGARPNFAARVDASSVDAMHATAASELVPPLNRAPNQGSARDFEPSLEIGPDGGRGFEPPFNRAPSAGSTHDFEASFDRAPPDFARSSGPPAAAPFDADSDEEPTGSRPTLEPRRTPGAPFTPSFAPRDFEPPVARNPMSTPAAPTGAPVDAAFEIDDDWSARLTDDDDRTILRPRLVGSIASAPAKTTTATVAPSPADFVDAEIEEDSEATTWPGLVDYDALLAQRDGDPAQLLGRMSGAAEELLGDRARALRPLFDRTRTQLEQLLSSPAAAADVQAARLGELTRGLDQLEDLFAALMVKP